MSKWKEGAMRTSVVLEGPLKANLSCLARKLGVSQGEIIRDALRFYLETKHQMDITKVPELITRIEYEEQKP